MVPDGVRRTLERERRIVADALADGWLSGWRWSQQYGAGSRLLLREALPSRTTERKFPHPSIVAVTRNFEMSGEQWFS